MKKSLLFFFTSIFYTNLIFGQNVGVGTNTPLDKLHISGAANSLRIDGLSSTGTFTGTGTPLRAVFVDANGSFVKGGAGTPMMDAWYTIGNSNTTAGTNFIGTTNAQAFVIKTNGSAAANERMRVLSGGTISVNNSVPFAGDVFSVYGTGYAGALNALGTFTINGYVGANGTAVYGESNSAAVNNGRAIWGQLLGTQTATGNTSYGTYGTNTTAPQGTGISIGSGGLATSTTGDARGVDGLTTSGAGIGVSGFNVATMVFMVKPPL